MIGEEHLLMFIIALDQFLPWLLTQYNIATDERMDDWPKEEYIFHYSFTTSMDAQNSRNYSVPKKPVALRSSKRYNVPEHARL
jgi:hypothetical protein